MYGLDVMDQKHVAFLRKMGKRVKRAWETGLSDARLCPSTSGGRLEILLAHLNFGPFSTDSEH